MRETLNGREGVERLCGRDTKKKKDIYIETERGWHVDEKIKRHIEDGQEQTERKAEAWNWKTFQIRGQKTLKEELQHGRIRDGETHIKRGLCQRVSLREKA